MRRRSPKRGSRASMRCVPLKTTEQLELQALHRVRRRVIIERTAVVNQMRALLLEHGIVIPLGRALFARRLPAIFEDAENGLSPRLVGLLHRLRQRWLALDVEIEDATRDSVGNGPTNPSCASGSATVPGIGPMIATAVVAAVGNGRCLRAAVTWRRGWARARDNTPRAANRPSVNQQAAQSDVASCLGIEFSFVSRARYTSPIRERPAARRSRTTRGECPGRRAKVCRGLYGRSVNQAWVLVPKKR